MEYDWEVKANDGYVEYEYFSPIAHDRQALEKASFTLTIPSDTKIRYMGLPHEWNPDKQSSGKNDVYVWNFPAMRCFIEDEYDDHYMFLLPSVLAMPYEFCLADTKGTLDTWENMGKWYAQLAEGRGKLLPADRQNRIGRAGGCVRRLLCHGTAQNRTGSAEGPRPG